MKTGRLHIFSLLALAALFAASCTKSGLDYLSAEGRAVIRADWPDGATPPPGGLKFYFYPEQGGAALAYEGSPTGFEGALPAGVYRVLAFNADASGVGFSGMDSFETASAYALADTRTRSLNYLTQPGSLYALVLDSLKVPLGQAVERRVAPDTLVRNVVFRFTFLGAESISSLTGVMRGVLSRVLLHTGETSTDAGVTAFSAQVSGNEATARVSVFGILDPMGNLPYRNLLNLILTLSDGTSRSTEVDLTEVVNDLLKSNGGGIPSEVPVKVELRLIDTGLVASAHSWSSGGGQGSVE